MSNSTNIKPKRKAHNALNTEKFIAKATAKHGDRYDYSKSVYTTAKGKLIIICRVHGEFMQEAYSHTIGTGCPSCARRNLESSFEEEARKIHGDHYDYSLVDYESTNKKVKIICKKHGLFEQTPSNHLMGKRCSLCAFKSRAKLKTFPFSEFERRSKEVHGGIYTYYENEYLGVRSKTRISCRDHGDFYQEARLHMTGTACPICSRITSGFGLTEFADRCDKNKNGDGILYIIKCWNDSEEFYKVGITSQGVNHRFKGKREMPYNFSIVRELVDSAETIYRAEKAIHRIMSKRKYSPKIHFGGHTECFSDIDSGVIKLVDKISKGSQLQLVV